MRTSLRLRAAEAGISLIEMLAYIAVLAVLITLTGRLFGQAWDQSRAIQRETDDIKRVLRVGELWRRDVRAANARIELQTLDQAQGVVIPTAAGQVVWLSNSNSVSRSASADHPEVVMLRRLSESRFVEDSQDGLRVWRWDLAPQPGRKHARITPWCSFTAVPPKEASK